MAAVRGMLTAVLGLIALETIVSTQGAADRTGGLLSDTAGIIDRIFDPTVPAIADRSGTIDDSATTKTSKSSTAPSNAGTSDDPNPATMTPAPTTPVAGAPIPTRPTVPTTPTPTPTGHG